MGDKDVTVTSIFQQADLAGESAPLPKSSDILLQTRLPFPNPERNGREKAGAHLMSLGNGMGFLPLQRSWLVFLWFINSALHFLASLD